jgi:hypothetical protein
VKVLLFVLCSAIVGWVCVWIGRRGKRVGTDPHCPKCDYNLTGAPLPRCAECGFDFSESGPVIGRFKRRPVFLAVGLIGLVLATVFVYGAWGETRHDLRYKYYSRWPTGLVIRDMRGPFRPQAVDELVRRCRAGTLSDEQARSVVEYLTAQLVQLPVTSQPPSEIVDGLAHFLLSDHLTHEQTFMFFRCTCIPQVVYTEGQLAFFRRRPLPTRMPFDDFVGHYKLKVLSVDGQPVQGLGVEKLTTASNACYHRLPFPLTPRESIHARLEIDWYGPLDLQATVKVQGLSPEEQLKAVLPRLRNNKRLCTITDEVTVTAKGKWVLNVNPKEVPGTGPSS